MPRNPKIGRMEAHHTGNPWTCLEVKRSNGVTKPINAVTDNAPYADRENSRDAKVKMKTYSIQ